MYSKLFYKYNAVKHRIYFFLLPSFKLSIQEVLTNSVNTPIREKHKIYFQYGIIEAF